MKVLQWAITCLLVVVASAQGGDLLLQAPAKAATMKNPYDGDERARMWPKIVADHENYAGYARRTRREIPLVLLTPR